MKIIDIDQGSDQWHVERFRCVTGTKIQQAIGAKYSAAKGWTLGDKKIQQTLLLELVAEFQSELEIDDYCSEAMERGNDLEPLSVVEASKRLNVNFVKCGMLQSDTLPNFKFSPDAVCLDKNGVVVGGYETKSKAGKKHIEYILNDELPPDHLWQCLCPMVMDDCVKWWYFGHYDDRNHINSLFSFGIKRADYEDLITQARELLIEFFADVNATVEKLGGVYHG
jgi:hypothetical protein